MEFANLYAQGFARVAARVLPVHLAEPDANARAIVDDVTALAADHVALVAYPELSLTGYSCGDLFLQQALLDATETAIQTLVTASRDLAPVIIVGAPVRAQHRLYNCALVIHRGRILGAVPKTYLANYREFYERRWFTPGAETYEMVTLAGQSVTLAPLIVEVTDVPGFTIAVEICEDMWVPVSPATKAALAGATVLVNISGSPITIGKADDRRLMAQSASLRCQAACLFTAAGPGESSTDLAWDGQTFVFEAGERLGESDRFPLGPAGTVVDIDLRRLAAERARQTSFDDNRRHEIQPRLPIAQVATTFDPPAGDLGLYRDIPRFPFVPADPARLKQDCYEAYSIQVAALVRRMQAIGSPKLVIGVSGGLDSTHALIVCARAMDVLGRPRSDILAFTMPGFATSDTTKGSALALMEAVGATASTLDIRPAARQMLADLGHPYAAGTPTYDVTFENVQAGLRTDYLFRIANQRGGIVVGTGDLSELALGWCTYGVGDHMSHYGVNAGVPKTLIQHLIRWVIAEGLFDAATNAVLDVILRQEISPELIPTAAGQPMQSTEAIIGPYALHDFSLFHLLRRGETPSRIAFLAWHAWRDRKEGAWPPLWDDERRVQYCLADIQGWLEFFLRRFFVNQFKRSTLPDGPKVTPGGTLSPRGDWRMPTDAKAEVWLRELQDNIPGGV
ncbi:MAG: NAD(+) synthase [Propionibacteriaceae bacterium]|jgi:NAD+ synthase (glutamine-hydrolysing)|nr:NAD(+) synthase [Propionibacteriaceae bacterium]